jgi:hypothetical protein
MKRPNRDSDNFTLFVLIAGSAAAVYGVLWLLYLGHAF